MQNVKKKEKCPWCGSRSTIKTGMIDHGHSIGTYHRCGKCNCCFGELAMKKNKNVINASEMELILDFEHP